MVKILFSTVSEKAISKSHNNFWATDQILILLILMGKRLSTTLLSKATTRWWNACWATLPSPFVGGHQALTGAHWHTSYHHSMEAEVPRGVLPKGASAAVLLRLPMSSLLLHLELSYAESQRKFLCSPTMQNAECSFERRVCWFFTLGCGPM